MLDASSDHIVVKTDWSEVRPIRVSE